MKALLLLLSLTACAKATQTPQPMALGATPVVPGPILPTGPDAGSCGSTSTGCVVTKNSVGQILSMASTQISTLKGGPILLDSADAGGITVWNGPDTPVLSAGIGIVNESVAGAGISVSDQSGNGIDLNTDGGLTAEAESANITTSGLDGGKFQIRAEGAPNTTLCLESGSVCTVRAGQDVDINGHDGVYLTSGGVCALSCGSYSGFPTQGQIDFSAFNSANLASAVSFSSTKFEHASTLTNASNITIDTPGVGTGPIIVKLCSDANTCGAGNIYLTCTAPGTDCTASPGATASCAVTKSAVAAGTTLTWVVTTACGTTDPAFNIVAHATVP